jgi:hypothetical protein
MVRRQDGWHFMWLPGNGLNIHQITWIWFFESPYSIISCTCNSKKRKKPTKYTKQSQNCPKFEQGVWNDVGRHHKKTRAKKQKKILPRVLNSDTRGSLKKRKNITAYEGWPSCIIFFLECNTRGKGPFPSAVLPWVPINLGHSGKPLFPECNTRRRASSSSARFFWHSGKPQTLGKFQFSRSGGSKLMLDISMYCLVLLGISNDNWHLELGQIEEARHDQWEWWGSKLYILHLYRPW